MSHTEAAVFQGWQIEGSGQYSESNGVIRIWGTEGITLYEEVSPQTDFSFSLQVNAAKLGGFGIFLRSSLPFSGSVQGLNVEFGARDGGTFLLARWTSYWTWHE